MVKAERNKIQSQIFLMQQVHAEFTEKNKILTNEIEILYSTVDQKDKCVFIVKHIPMILLNNKSL